MDQIQGHLAGSSFTLTCVDVGGLTDHDSVLSPYQRSFAQSPLHWWRVVGEIVVDNVGDIHI
jgi:hypothetical protein